MRPTTLIILLVMGLTFVRGEAHSDTKRGKAKLLNLRITYLHSAAQQGENAQEFVGKLTTSWITPKGSRTEDTKGQIVISLTQGPIFYYLYPETKTGIRVNLAQVRSAFASKKDKQTFAAIKAQLRPLLQQPSQSERFLGRTCRLLKYSLQTAEGTSKVTTWTADIGGHSVTLRVLTQLYKNNEMVGVQLMEAVQIETMARVPAELLQIPSDYAVKEMDWETIQQTPDALRQVFKDVSPQ